ncbi:histidine kinase [Kribbella sancticallisti]|uniref:histidine kinase n=1 Tax=Kribbella sancticallisti TaxID=460087 RepID=A0ABP4PIK8_9ACTN
MEHVRNWLLPVLLGAAWVASTAGSHTLLGTPPPGGAETIAGAVASVIAAAALGFRRRAPLPTLGVVTVAVVIGQFATAPDGLGVPFAETIALYSVAVHSGAAVAWRATAVLVVVRTAASFGVYGLAEDFAYDAVGNLVIYLVILVVGQNRRRRLAVRAEVARQLWAAEERQRDAAAAERRRLARELHDVSAHHLTSIVVSSGAAERLIDRQPDLAEQALEYAASTGRATLVALRRLVDVLETGDGPQREPAGARISELAEAFTRLGQQVRVDVAPELTGPSAEAVFGIVRESLTNTVRYAPGAAVRILVRRAADHLLVLVDNGEGTAPASVGQGSGRGITGMKDRAEAVGGTLTAGPGPDGGWQVRATLPACGVDQPNTMPSAEMPNSAWAQGRFPVAPLPEAARRDQAGPDRAVPVSRVERWTMGAGLALLVALVATGGTAMMIAGEPGAGPATTSLAVLLALIPALALLRRHDRPRSVVTVVAVFVWLWPLAIGFGLMPTGFAPAMVMSLGAPMAAASAASAYGGRATWWWSVPAAAGGFGATVAVLEVVAPSEPPDPGFAVFFSLMIALLTAIPLLGSWAIGALVRRRRLRRVDNRGQALADVVRAAEIAVHTERRRIARGLHHNVLTRTSRMIAHAEAGRLEGVTAEARSALAAMRDLLDTLHDDGAPAPRSPRPTEMEVS